jgi:hypothetical protein
MARPRIQVDLNLLEGLAQIGCTDVEIAVLVGCSVDTLNNRFSEILDKGRQSLRMRLRKAQLNAAENGNIAMLIWLGKQYLNQRDRMEVDVTALEAEIDRRLAQLAARGETETSGEAESETVN